MLHSIRLVPGLVAAAAWAPGAALAEVCDKAVGEAWRTGDGPVWLLNPVGWPIGILALLAGLLLAARGAKWIGYGVAAFLVAQIAVRLFIDGGEMYRAQLDEGCRSLATDWADMGLLALFAMAYGWLGLRRHRAEMARIVETDS
jgi:hypothetical protein